MDEKLNKYIEIIPTKSGTIKIVYEILGSDNEKLKQLLDFMSQESTDITSTFLYQCIKEIIDTNSDSSKRKLLNYKKWSYEMLSEDEIIDKITALNTKAEQFDNEREEHDIRKTIDDLENEYRKEKRINPEILNIFYQSALEAIKLRIVSKSVLYSDKSKHTLKI